MKWFDEFGIKFTPRWFEYLQWILILGTLHYLATELKIQQAVILLLVSLFALSLYFQGYFYNIQLEGITFIKNKKAKKLISLALGFILTVFAYLFIHTTVVQISGKF